MTEAELTQRLRLAKTNVTSALALCTNEHAVSLLDDAYELLRGLLNGPRRCIRTDRLGAAGRGRVTFLDWHAYDRVNALFLDTQHGGRGLQ